MTLRPTSRLIRIGQTLLKIVITLREFHQLRTINQVNLLWEKGQLVGFRDHAELYILGSFFVEVIFVELLLAHSTDEILFLHAFEDTAPLSPYLQQIDLIHLF